MGCVRRYILGSLVPSSLPAFNIRITGSYAGPDFFGKIFNQINNLDAARGSMQHPGEAVASLQEFWRTDNTSTGFIG